jgi:hypothetical protein
MGYSGAGAKLIHEKTRSKKSCDNVPLNVSFVQIGVLFLKKQFLQIKSKRLQISTSKSCALEKGAEYLFKNRCGFKT